MTREKINKNITSKAALNDGKRGCRKINVELEYVKILMRHS